MSVAVLACDDHINHTSMTMIMIQIASDHHRQKVLMIIIGYLYDLIHILQ
jgi:hypothetical protein